MIRYARYILITIVGIGLLCAFLASAPPSLLSLVPYGSVLEHLRMAFFWGAWAIVLTGLLMRARPLALGGVLLALLNGWFVAPTLWAGSDHALDEEAPADVRLLHANIWVLHPHLERVADMLNREVPDVVGIVELTDPASQIWLSRLGDHWPYRVDCAPAGCGNIILSRWPATRLVALSGWHDGPPYPNIMAARIHHPTKPFTLVVTHLSRATEPDKQNPQAGWMEGWLKTLPPPVVVTGDFNAAPWSMNFERVEQSGITRLGATGPTWPVGPLLPIGIPIDHVLGGPGVAALSVRPLPFFGSDHRALIAEIQLPEPRGLAKAAGEGGDTPPLVPAP